MTLGKDFLFFFSSSQIGPTRIETDRGVYIWSAFLLQEKAAWENGTETCVSVALNHMWNEKKNKVCKTNPPPTKNKTEKAAIESTQIKLIC